jgi:hypothetical protein
LIMSKGGSSRSGLSCDPGAIPASSPIRRSAALLGISHYRMYRRALCGMRREPAAGH